MSAINPVVAAALMPYDSFAQRRADDAQILQHQASAFALDQQAAQMEAMSKRDMNQKLAIAAQLDVLPPDQARIANSFVNPWRDKAYQIIKDTYHGKVSQFMANEGEALMGQMMDQIAQSPELMTAQENKNKYAEYLKNNQDGKIHRGDADAAWLNFRRGVTPTFDYRGGYDRPKVTALDFAKMENPDAPYGTTGTDGRRIAPKVTVDQYMASLGMSHDDAADWAYDKGGFQPGMKWGMKDPLSLEKFKLDQMEFTNKVRQQGIDNGYQAKAAKLGQQHLTLDWWKAMHEKGKSDAAAAKEAAAALPAVSYNPMIYGDTPDPISGKVEMGNRVVTHGVATYQRPINDSGLQKRVLELIGAKPLEDYKDVAGSQKKTVQEYNGKPLFEVNTGQILDAKRPWLGYNTGSGKHKVFDIDLTHVVSLDPTKIGIGKQYLPTTRSNTYVRAKAVMVNSETGKEEVQEVFLPADASDNARTLNDQRDMMYDKPDQKKTLAELYRQVAAQRDQERRVAEAVSGQSVPASGAGVPDYFPKK